MDTIIGKWLSKFPQIIWNFSMSKVTLHLIWGPNPWPSFPQFESGVFLVEMSLNLVVFYPTLAICELIIFLLQICTPIHLKMISKWGWRKFLKSSLLIWHVSLKHMILNACENLIWSEKMINQPRLDLDTAQTTLGGN